MVENVNKWRCPDGLSGDEVVKHYEEWMLDKDFNYDAILEHGYKGPNTLAQHMKPHLDKITNLRKILDVGAGTGFLAMELKLLIGENVILDALEPSTKMREAARAQNLYTDYYGDFVNGLNSTSLPSDTYDCVCSTGCFVPSHIPKEGTLEMMRLTRIGGIIAFIMRASYLDDHPGYEGFMEVLERMEADGVAEKVEVTYNVPFFGKHKGLVVVYRKIGKI